MFVTTVLYTGDANKQLIIVPKNRCLDFVDPGTQQFPSFPSHLHHRFHPDVSFFKELKLDVLKLHSRWMAV